MKARLVIENIDFERGISPVRGLGIGAYADIYKKFKDSNVNINEAIQHLTELSKGIQIVNEDKLRPNKKLFGVMNHYRKDSYHTDKVDFIYDWIWDIAWTNWTPPSEEEFMKKTLEFTEKVDYQPTQLIDTIRGLYYAYKSDLSNYY